MNANAASEATAKADEAKKGTDQDEEAMSSSATLPDPSSTNTDNNVENETATEPSQDELAPSNTKRMRSNTKGNNNNSVDRNGNALNTTTTNKKVKTKHMDPLVLETRRTIQQCCKTNDFHKAFRVYQEALQKEIRMEAATFYSLLNLCDGLDHRRIHVGTPKPTTPGYLDPKTTATTTTDNRQDKDDLQIRLEAAFGIQQRMHELQLPLNETAYTALVKLLTRSNDLRAALEVLQRAEENPQYCRLKLRLYAPLLQAYCVQGHLRDALRLWERLEHQNKLLQQQPHLKREKLQLGEVEYAALVECCAKYGGKPQTPDGVTAHEAAQVVQKVFTDLSEDVLVPSKETCAILVEWFQSEAAKYPETNPKSSSILSHYTLPSSQVHEDQPIGPVQCFQPHQQWIVSPHCRIDTATGTLLTGCLKHEILQPVALSEPAWQEMLTLNETIVLSGKLDRDTSAFQGGKKGKKRKLGADDQEQRTKVWKRFNDFLQQNNNTDDDNGDTDKAITKKSFDIIIDGANVGYYQQNFCNAPRHVDYRQIDSVVQHFQNIGKKVLLVMHHRHFTHHQMPARFRPILQHWQREGILYQTPAGMNDDWFWMHAALVLGPGTLVLTNDEMRDHHFQMLSPRSFLRWKDRHQVHFSFGANGGPPVNGVGGSGYRPVILEYPEIYSRRIQRVADGYVIPHPKRGDENRFLDGTHEAKEDTPVEETYLCIRPTRVPENDAVEDKAN